MDTPGHPHRPSGPAPPRAASAFVIAGFLLIWLMGLCPLLASLLADVHPAAVLGLFVLLPSLMTAVVYPLWLAEEDRDSD
jgi:hypothetical protein